MIVLIIFGVLELERSACQGAREVIPEFCMNVLVVKSH